MGSRVSVSDFETLMRRNLEAQSAGENNLSEKHDYPSE